MQHVRATGIALIILGAVCVRGQPGTCRIPNQRRIRCESRSTTIEQCRVRGCCWDRFARSGTDRCYQRRRVLQISFRPSASPENILPFNIFPGIEQDTKNYLTIGGEPKYPGSSVVRRCSASRSTRRCGFVGGSNRNSCARFGCCWNENNCFRAVFNVIKLRDNCPPGRANPPSCNEIDECYPNPCYDGAHCTDLVNGFKCDCPFGTAGLLCEPGCPPPDAIDNGYYSNNRSLRYDINTAAEYRCFEDFTLLGFPFNVCLPGGFWSLVGTNLPVCSIGCDPPGSIDNGYFANNQTTDFEAGTFVEYLCNPGYTLDGNSFNVCLAGGTWLLSGSALPTCGQARDPDLDVLIILDSTDPLDDCLNRLPIEGHFPPFLPGPVRSRNNFPNFFRQQDFVSGFDAEWDRVALAHTRLALQLHMGTCRESDLLNLFPVQRFEDTALVDPRLLLSLIPNFCTTPDFPSVVACANNYHFTAIMGERQTAPNIIILVVPEVSRLNTTGLSEQMATARNLLTADLYTVTAAIPFSSTYLSNLQFLSDFTCGPGAAPCSHVLGSIHDNPNFLANNLRSSLGYDPVL